MQHVIEMILPIPNSRSAEKENHFPHGKSTRILFFLLGVCGGETRLNFIWASAKLV